MTVQDWTPEKTLDQALAQQLIESQFPQLAPAQLESFGAGWDNTVYAVNQQWVFRFPRRQMALALMDSEWQLLKALAQPEFKQPLGLQLPQAQFWGQASQDFDWPFVGYRLVEGQTACRAQLSQLEREALIPQLAAFLNALHHLPLGDLPPLPDDKLRRMDIAWRLPKLQERLDFAAGLGLLQAERAGIAALLNSLPATTPAGRPRCLVHGDLYIRHLIVNPARQLTGVIDWGDAHQGDPAVDLAIVYAALPPATRRSFWLHYGEVSAETQLLSRFRALYSCLMILIYGQQENDRDLVREGQQGIQWLLQADGS